jgi:hypothetical protein
MSPDINQAYVYELVALAGAYFGVLSEAETRLLAAVQMGGFAFCGPSSDLSHPSNDPAKSSDWGNERNVRASLIRWLCFDRTARDRVNPSGIRVSGARVTERLNLSYGTVPFGLTLVACCLVEDADLASTSLAELNLRGSWVRSLYADCIKVNGGVFLSDGFQAEGEVRLPAAQIGIDLSCENSLFANPSKVALNADGISVKRSVLFRENFRSVGEVRLLGAQIGGNLECDGASLKNAPLQGVTGSGIALYADRVIVGGYVFFRNGFGAEGKVMLHNAEISGNLECQNALLHNQPLQGVPCSGTALSADGICVKGDVLLSDGFRARGQIRIRGANIGGNLNCENGAFSNPSKMALDADRVRVAGYVFLQNGFSAEGEVKFLNAEVGSNLECDNAKFRNLPQQGTPGTGMALNADSIKIRGYAFLRKGFGAEGQVNFLNAQIGNDFECKGATLKNPSQENVEGSGIALCLDSASVQGIISLGQGFNAEGEVRVCHAEVGRHLVCEKAKVEGRFIARASTVAGGFYWTHIVEPKLVELDVVNTHANALVDDRPSWPENEKLRIDGLVYERFSGSDTPKTVAARLDWLSRQKGFAPQPYRQVARVLRNNGDDVGARRVLSKMERLRRNHESAGRKRLVRFWASVWSAVLRATIGYGFHPARSLWWLAGLTALGALVFSIGYAAGSIAPNEKEAYVQFTANGSLPPQYEHFNPLIYSLENSFPLIRFGQTEHWQPALDVNRRSTAKPWIPKSLSQITSPWSLRRFRWLQICLGWFFTTMGVAAVSGIVRKE